MLWLSVEGNQPINEDDTYAEMYFAYTYQQTQMYVFVTNHAP